MNPTTTKVSARFRRLADMVDMGLVLKPKLDLYLHEAKFPDKFSVTFHKAGVPREPDGWFHPSTHPLWGVRQLYYYLARPDMLEVEQLSYESRMAVTMGTATHGFVEMCLRDIGVMIPLEGICPACKRPHGTGEDECDEPGAADEEVGSRGHLDGIVSIMVKGTIWFPGLGGFEFKSTNPNATGARLKDNDIEGFMEAWPEYYAQVQEYMEITGLRQFLVIVAVLGWPWKLIEFQIPYDLAHNMAIRAKYATVREHVEAGVLTEPCFGCGPRSKMAKSCPVRLVCPIGLA